MVEKKKNAIAIRCHKIGEAEKKLYSFVAEYFGKENTFFVMNVDPATVKVPEGYNHIIFNHETILSREDLFWPQDVAWKCGDYCYYALHHALSGYSYFWLMESDIQFCCNSAETFFSDFEQHDADFLAPRFGRAAESLYFYHTAKTLESEPMSCLFGITRLNPAVIPKLVGTRQKLSKQFYEKQLAPSLYPNDEIFVSTAGARLGLRCAPLDKLSSFNFMMFSVEANASFFEEDLLGINGKFIVHPLMDENTFLDKKMRRFDNLWNQSYPLLDFMAQSVTKCSNQKLQKQLKEQFQERLNNFVSNL